MGRAQGQGEAAKAATDHWGRHWDSASEEAHMEFVGLETVCRTLNDL